MAGAIVQSVAANASASATTLSSGNLPATTTAGNYLLVITDADDTTCTCADGLGNTFTERTNAVGAAIVRRMRIFTAPITSAGTSNAVTATWGASKGLRFCAVLEISGVNAFDGAAAGTDEASNNPAPSPALSVTNSAQPAFCVGIGYDPQGVGSATGSGYTAGPTFTPDGGGSGNVRTQYKTVTTVGAQTAQFGNAGFDRCKYALLIFLEGGGGGGGVVGKSNVIDQAVKRASVY